jgi:amino acid transporter
MRSAQPQATDEGLVRAIGTRTLAASIVNTTVGAGIFVLPAVVAGGIGPAAPLAYLICALAMALVVTSFAIAGSRVSLSGGIYAYVEVAFGPYVGFLSGVLLYLSNLLAVASVAGALASSVGLVVPMAGAGPGRAVFLCAVIAAFAWINVRGVQVGARTVEIGTAAKLLPLVVFVGVGAWFIQPAALAWTTAPAPAALGNSVLLLVFAFVGIEVALVPSGEVTNPSRTVPRAIYIALATSTVLYVAVHVVAQGVLGEGLAQSAAAPLADASQRFLGAAGRSMMLAGAAVSMLSYMSGDALGTPRLIFAFGRDGFLPAIFARVHPRYGTPAVAIVTHAAIAATLAATGTFAGLLVMANVAVLSLYLVCCAAAWALARRDVRADGQPFRAPGGSLLPLAACGAMLAILWNATAREFGVEALVLAVATVLFLLKRRARAATASA